MEAVMTYAQAFFGWLLQTSLIASLVICLILLIQKLLGGRLGPRWSYALWLVLLIRMILPWSPSSRVSLSNLIPSWNGQIQSQQSSGTVEVQEVSTPEQAAEAPETITGQEPQSELAAEKHIAPRPRIVANAKARTGPQLILLHRVLPILWLAGTIVIGVYLLFSDLALWRIVKRDRPLINQAMLELFEECKTQMGVQSLVVVVPSDRVRSPGLFGFVRPRLLLPRQMLDSATAEEMRYVFLHELAHLRRHDIYLGWLTSLLQVLHWFNPLVWFAFYRMRADRELACDALVLTRTGQDKSREYGGAIIELVRSFSRSRPLPAMAGIIESKSQLKRRIAMITEFKNNSYRWSALGIGIIVVFSIVTMTGPIQATTSSSPTPQAKSAMTMRLVEKDISGFASVSPDGKYLCDAQLEGGEVGEAIVIRELATGEKHTIKPAKGAPDENGPACPLISPDGKTIAYAAGQIESAFLRLIGTDGSGQRDLCSGVVPVQWFPDGSQILGFLLRPKGNTGNIVSVSISDGSVHAIKGARGNNGWAMGIRLSPDAKYIAYDLPAEKGSAKRDIFAVEIDSGRETTLVQHSADDRLLDWTPDGRSLLFASDRLGAWDAWLLPVAEGKAQGTPKLVARNIGLVTLKGFARNGSYYYEVAYNRDNVYTAEVDLNIGRLLSAPVPLPAAGHNGYADWSPDGRSLAYCSYPEPSRQPHVIRIRSLATGEERELLPKLPMVRCLCWSPDGRSVLASRLTVFENGQEEWPGRVCRVDVDTGESTVVLQTDSKNGGVWRAELSPNEKTLYYSQGLAIFQKQIENGDSKKLFDFPEKAGGHHWLTWALSPNGQSVAVSFNEPTKKEKECVSMIVVVPSDGGEIDELLRRDELGGELSEVAWSPDNKTVLFTIQRDFDTIEFWQIPAAGGEPRKIAEASLGWCYSLCVHPDGQRIAFMAGKRHHELWAMENFLPEDAGK
jgi:beta-lactamase regulating signal transducer with metallopeptidase domain/Tol biopolymer transport system component